MPIPTSSIRLRVTLLICGLVLAVIAAYATAAYEQMRRAAVDNAATDVTNVVGQLAEMLSRNAMRARAEVDSLAALPEVRALLSDGAAGTAPEALQRPDSGDAVVGIEVRNRAGQRVAASGPVVPGDPERLDPDLRALTEESEPGGTGPLRRAGGDLIYPVVAAVSGAGEPSGFLVGWVEVGRSSVLSTGARLYLANTRGDLWTDMNVVVEPLPVDPDFLHEGGEAERVGGMIVARAPVLGAPWTVALGLPLEVMLAGPREMIGRMVLFGMLLLLVVGAAAWLLTGRLTGSIAELASAARAISGGDYSRRTPVRGQDEVGVLGEAFNSMAASVAHAHHQLEDKIRELERSEADHRETRERMEHVISSSRVLLYKYSLADREVHLDWVSDNVRRLLGYEPEEALRPGYWRRLLHPDDRDRFRASRARLETEGSVTLEYRLRHARGEFRWVRDEQRLLRDRNGNAKEVVGVLSDLSEQHRLAGEKAAAEAASLAKSEFLSRMSHELRTPLNSVLGFGQLLQLDLESEENRESIDQILKAGKHLLSLIDEVLDIARIESGQMSLSVEPVWVKTTVRDALDLVRLTAADQGITVQAVDALHCDRFVWADQQRLKQVLLNLLSNAIKYNRREGWVTVTCVSSGEGEGERLRIMVEDNGFGIPEERMELLFTPFERLGAEQAGVEGTGLGLALSRGLMEAMGGSLSATSEEGRGSCFWVELPIAPRPMLVESDGMDVPSVETEVVAEVTHSVLFIEDNLANVRLVERLFQRRPAIELLTAMQGSLGLQLARERRPELILLDLNLPDMPGDVVLRQIRQDPELREIPVVMISGDAIPSQVQRILDLGARAYITKPFDLQDLLRVVDELLAA